LHAIELVGHLFFLILLISYTLHPPNKPVVYAEFIGWGEGVLIFLSIALSLQKPSFLNIPFYLTLFAFLFALPSVPFLESASFSLMLISVFILLFQFHLLRTPSPLFLFSRSHTLPFVTFLHHGVLRTIGSLLLFFLPAFLVPVLSLADVPYPPFRLQRAMITTPIDVQIAYLYLLSVVITVFIICFFITIPLSVSYTSSTDTWDRYSVAIGNAARATFFREVVKYSQSYYFPSPFNCVHLIFIRIPTLAFRTFRVAPAAMEGFERMVWRITVGPFAAVTKLLTIPLP